MKALVAPLVALLALSHVVALAGDELVPLGTLRGAAAAAAVLVVAWGGGVWLLRRIDPARDGPRPFAARDHATGLLLGIGALAVIGLALALAGLYRPGALVLALVALLPLVPAAARPGAARVDSARPDPRAPGSSHGALARPARVLLWSAGVATLLAALPPVSWFDALEYHAALPALYLMEGRLVDLPHDMFSHLPHLFTLVSGYAFALDHAAPVALLHWAAGACLLVGTASLGERLAPGAGLLAAALLASAHVVTDCATAPGVDLYVAACAVHALDRAVRARDEPAGLVLAALLCGLAVASKVHGLLAVAAVAAALLVAGDVARAVRGRWRALAAACAVAVLLPAPFLARTWLRHGSPVWPFLDRAPDVAAWTAAVVAKTRLDGIDGGDVRRLPAEAFLYFFRRDGWNPGVLAGLAAALISGRAPRRDARAVAAFAAVVLAGWLLGARVDRYALPALPALAALAAAGIVGALAEARSRAARFAWSAAVAVPLATAVVVVVLDAHRLRDPLSFLSGRLATEDYLEWAVERSPQALLLRANRELPPDARVVSFDDPRLFHLWRPWRASTAYDRPLLRAMIAAGARGGDAGGGAPAERLWRAVRAEGFTHVLVNPPEARFLATAFPGLQTRTRDEDEALRALLAAHGHLLFARNGAALFEVR